MLEDAIFRYNFDDHRIHRGAWQSAPHIIDSWLHAGGRSRGLSEHFRRFRSALDGVVDADHIQRFLDSVHAELPSAGDWFPRLEYADGSGLALRLRPAPPRQREAGLWTFPAPDPRKAPAVKGPDMAALRSIQGSARYYHADDAVLTSAAGHVLEGSTTALMWWEADTLCAPLPTEPVLPSVTRLLIEGTARSLDIEVVHVNRPADFVAGHPCWVVNALHGIRTVVTWVGYPPLPQISPNITALFRGALDTYRPDQLLGAEEKSHVI